MTSRWTPEESSAIGLGAASRRTQAWLPCPGRAVSTLCPFRPPCPSGALCRPGAGPKCRWLRSDANKAPSELQSPLLGVSWPRPAGWCGKATWGDVGGAQAAVLHWAWCPHRLVSSSGACAGEPLALRGIAGSLPCRRGGLRLPRRLRGQGAFPLGSLPPQSTSSQSEARQVRCPIAGSGMAELYG